MIKCHEDDRECMPICATCIYWSKQVEFCTVHEYSTGGWESCDGFHCENVKDEEEVSE